MASITCGSCKKTHSSINEVKSCFAQNKNFAEEAMTTTPVAKVIKTKAPVTKVIKKASDPVVKDYEIKTFSTKPEAEEFVKNTPASRLSNTVKVAYLDGIQVKTYTVIIKK